MAKATRYEGRTRRHARVREKIRGSAARPRLAIFRSLTHIYAQLVDDDAGTTLAAASSLDVRTPPAQGKGPLSASGSERAAAAEPKSEAKRTETAKSVGTLLADRAKQKGVTEVVFDRGGYRYHGRVKALAEGVRAAGVKL
jgi:large subunit ribosomal protein L18